MQAFERADQRGDAAGAFNLGVLLKERGEVERAAEAFARARARREAGV
ncbi:hypothetical protein GKE82_24250 [Conexibacter sp. W3-3-2]|nr:hypothetical protein [Conexibacter sp. W3-3-2]MTD47321.1 hypothetical protein [Conexibacter sp. W3-3-2]